MDDGAAHARACAPRPELALAQRSPRQPAIAQLVEHLTVDGSRYEMVPGSIPGGRVLSTVIGMTRVFPLSHGNVAVVWLRGNVCRASKFADVLRLLASSPSLSKSCICACRSGKGQKESSRSRERSRAQFPEEFFRAGAAAHSRNCGDHGSSRG